MAMVEWFNQFGESEREGNVFETVKRSCVYEKVVDQVEEAILSDRLGPGSRLPSERKLTEVFHASRRTLREAMRVLEQKGLIEVRTGSKGGAFVTDRSSDRMRDSFSILIRKKKIPYENLFEFRMEIESEIAGLAARRASPRSMKALKDLLADIGGLAANGLASREEFNAQETKLHLTLGLMCGNPLYEVILGIIHEILVFPSFKVVHVDERYLREAHRDWSAIVGAIAKRQSALSRSLMRRHLKRFSRYHRLRGEVFDGRGWKIEAKST
jgi:GntR family transcriptional regulator, transcriptional repressor for pyruvate dehydrogenase complex